MTRTSFSCTRGNVSRRCCRSTERIVVNKGTWMLAPPCPSGDSKTPKIGANCSLVCSPPRRCRSGRVPPRGHVQSPTALVSPHEVYLWCVLTSLYRSSRKPSYFATLLITRPVSCAAKLTDRRLNGDARDVVVHITIWTLKHQHVSSPARCQIEIIDNNKKFSYRRDSARLVKWPFMVSRGYPLLCQSTSYSTQ